MRVQDVAMELSDESARPLEDGPNPAWCRRASLGRLRFEQIVKIDKGASVGTRAGGAYRRRSRPRHVEGIMRRVWHLQATMQHSCRGKQAEIAERTVVHQEIAAMWPATLA